MELFKMSELLFLSNRLFYLLGEVLFFAIQLTRWRYSIFQFTLIIKKLIYTKERP
jgi:hypothetical protein